MRAALEADDRLAAQPAEGGRHDPGTIRPRPRQLPRGVDERRGARRRYPSSSSRRRSPRRCPRRQVRVYPWDRVAGRGGLPGTHRFALVATAALLSLVAFGSLGGGVGHRAGAQPEPSPSPTPTPSFSPFPPTPSPSPFPATPIVPTASVATISPQSLATDGKALWMLTSTGAVATDRHGGEHGRAGDPDRRDDGSL